MDARDARQLGFKMRDRPQVWIVRVEVTEGAAQQREQFRLVMIALGANLDQLDEICGRLSPNVILPNTGEGILEDDLSQGMQRRFAAGCDRYLGFKEEIELAGEWRLGATGAFGHGLNAAERLGAPGNNQAGVAKLAFAQKNRGRALHATNLARDR